MWKWALMAVLGMLPAGAQDIRPDQQAFRGLYKELVETNTAISNGSCTVAAERMAARLKAAELGKTWRPFRVAGIAEEIGAHVVVNSVYFPAEPAEEVDNLRSNQSGRPGNQQFSHEIKREIVPGRRIRRS